MKKAWFIIVFMSGALLPLQTGFNNKLGKAAESPIYSSMICFIVGAVKILFYLPFAKESVSWPD
jgi:bacterial/archaeal transporter family-2 protein